MDIIKVNCVYYGKNMKATCSCKEREKKIIIPFIKKVIHSFIPVCDIVCGRECLYLEEVISKIETRTRSKISVKDSKKCKK